MVNILYKFENNILLECFDMISRLHYNRIIKYITGDKRTMTLESIMSAINTGDGVDIMKEAHSSISTIKDEVFYVQPNYDEIKKDSEAKFIIFSAPGASGKSALAKYIAFKHKGIYWDLSQITLGENSFHGTLWRALNQDGFINYFQNIKNGKSVLVLDAFDEAEMISGRSGVEFFLNDLNEATSGSTCPTVFLFARTESAAFIADYCEKKDIRFSQYEIGFFAEYNAKEFVKKKLEAEGKNITATVNECINQQFVVINRLLGQAEISNSFLGYAPVLEALAKAYDEERNTIKLLERLKTEDISSTKIVYSILDYLLDREHEKVCSAFREKWSIKYPEFTDWNEVYSKKEQIVRIAEYILLGGVEEKSFYECREMPDELYGDYYDSIKLFLPQHPYLQNLLHGEGFTFTGPAFRDYILASLLADERYIDLALEYFSTNLKTVHFSSQLLIDFYYHISTGGIRGNIFHILYDSYKAKETAVKHAVINMNQGGDEIYLNLGLKNEENGQVVDELEFRVYEGEAIHLSKLSNATIDIERTVVIGDAQNSARIYNSSIIANEIVFNSNCIEIEAKEPGYCLLVSEKDAVNRMRDIPKFEIRVEADELLKIDIPNINNYYRLRKYQYNFESFSVADYFKFNLAVKKIMNCMRKHRKDVPAKDKEFIDNEIINKNEFRRSIMDFLIQLGIIFVDSREPHLYKLDVDVLAAHGLNWNDFGCDVDDELRNLYKEFMV